MAEADESNSPADIAQSQRKVACTMPMSGSSIEDKPDRLRGEVNWTWQPSATPSPPNSPPPLAPNLSYDLASAASERLQLRTSAEHPVMLGSGAQ